MKTLLTSTPNLTHIKMDARLMHRNLVGVFSCSAVQLNLAKLKILEILAWDYEINNFRIANSRSIISDDSWSDAEDDEETFTANMNVLTTTALHLSRLEGLRLTNDPCTCREYFWKPISISTLLQNNQATIQSLSIHLGSYWSCDDLRTLTVSRLKCITATIEDYKGQESLEAFLKNHLSSLKELDISLKDEFTRTLFQVIKRLSPSLKKLHLRAKYFTHDSYIQGGEEEIDWSFLKGMNHLKDFKIVQTSKSKKRETEYLPSLFECLPLNQLERLSCKGIKDTGFWKITNSALDDFNLDGSFRDLRRLSFRRCKNEVNNERMQLIFREMSSLEELEITHCLSLTDTGIAGDPQNRNSLSIRNLRREFICRQFSFYCLQPS